MGWLAPLLGTGFSALSGALGGGDQKQTTSFNIAPQYEPLINILRSQFMNPKDVNLSGYESTGIGNINSVFDILKRERSNNLTARGLSTSPVAGVADEMGEMARGGQITTLQNSLPLMQRQFTQENQNNLLNLIKTLSGQESVIQGNPVASAFSDAGSMLGWMAGQGMFGGK